MSGIQEEIETLAALQALYNAIGEQINTSDPDNLRGRVNSYYHDLYEDTGATGFEVRVGGEKVGTYGFNKRKGQPERTERRLEVVDASALMDWESEDFDRWVRHWLAFHREDLAIEYAEETGELPDGVELVKRTIPAVPDTIRPNGTLRIKRQVVERARNMLAGGGLAGLLGGTE